MKTRDRTSVILVDGSNIYATAKQLGFDVDYKKLLDSFDGVILKAFYFTALRVKDEQSVVRPMVDFLEYNGWTAITKPTQEWRDEDSGALKIKGNMDIEIATVAMEMAPFCTDMIFLTGDGDFRFLVESLQRRYGIVVTVVSTIATQPPMCADNLRRQADEFIDLASMRNAIERPRTSDARNGHSNKWRNK